MLAVYRAGENERRKPRGGWRLKSRLKDLRPRSPPARTLQKRTLPFDTHGQERISETCAGRFCGGAQRGPLGAVLTAC